MWIRVTPFKTVSVTGHREGGEPGAPLGRGD